MISGISVRLQAFSSESHWKLNPILLSAKAQDVENAEGSATNTLRLHSRKLYHKPWKGSLQQHHEGSVLVHDTLHLQLNDARESLSNNIRQKRRFIQGRKLGYHPCCGSGIDFPSTHGKFHSWRRLQNTRFTVVRMDVLHLFGGGLYHAADHHAPALQGDWESDIQLRCASRPVSFLLYSELDQSVGR